MALRRKAISLKAFCSSMIFSEDRYPLSGSCSSCELIWKIDKVCNVPFTLARHRKPLQKTRKACNVRLIGLLPRWISFRSIQDREKHGFSVRARPRRTGHSDHVCDQGDMEDDMRRSPRAGPAIRTSQRTF